MKGECLVECTRCGREISGYRADDEQLYPVRHGPRGSPCKGVRIPAFASNDARVLKRKFGYDHMVEMRAIEAQLSHLPEIERYFAAIKEYQRRHANDPTYRERIEAARARGEKWVSPAKTTTSRPSPPSLTADEIGYLLERLVGVNDPLGASAAAKLSAMR